MSHKDAKLARHTVRASILINLTGDGRIEVKGIPNNYNMATEMVSAAQKCVYGYFMGRLDEGKFDMAKGEVIPDTIIKPSPEQVKEIEKVTQ
jgi:hypothetical protein